MTLYFFRIRVGYCLTGERPSKRMLNKADEDALRVPRWAIYMGWRWKQGWPRLELNQCVTVTLTVAGKSKPKPKRARKGG